MTTSSSGVGRLKPPHFALVPWARLMAPVFGDDTGMTLAHDLYFGGMPQASVEIPWSWLRAQIRVRQDTPYSVAEVSVTGGETARVTNPTARRVWPFSATLDSIAGADAGNLAQWVIDYYDTSRPRLRDLTLRLNGRTTGEIERILSVSLGSRITLTGLPAGYAAGAAELVVEGIKHRMDAAVRDVVWTAVPLVGAEVAESGPWFRLDESRVDSTTDLLPF